MATDNCNQVNIPTTDNTPLDCQYFIQSKCVEVAEGNAFILSNDNDSLDEFNDKLIDKLISMNQRLVIVEGESVGTSTYSFELSGTTLTLNINDDPVATVNLTSLTSGGVSETKESIISTGGENTIVLSNNININYPVQLIVEGITMLEGVGNDYTVSGNTINLTLTAPLQAGNIVQVYYKY